MTKKKLREAIDRIQRMEVIFDTLRAGASCDPPVMEEALLKILLDYYTSGQWLKDYELDEKGYLPPDVKRGVLSEDGVYNFLEDIHPQNPDPEMES